MSKLIDRKTGKSEYKWSSIIPVGLDILRFIMEYAMEYLRNEIDYNGIK